jgi:hypothetical protein
VRGPADAEDIAHLDAIDVAATRPRSRRQRWQKVPDKPLGEVVEERIRRRVRMGIDDPQSADEKIGRIRRRK